MATSQQSSGADHGMIQAEDERQSIAPPQSDTPLAMSDLDRQDQAGLASAQGLLNSVDIPTTSPITTSFPAGTTEMQSANSGAPYSKETTMMANSQLGEPGSSSKETTAASAVAGPSSTTASPDQPPPITRLDSVAIGPSTDTMPTPQIPAGAGPTLMITLLLGSGARHPYKIDERYLTKRNVNVPGLTESGKKDPYSISVYTLKELILREWREEWEQQPSSPSSIRLIFFGRLLDDKLPLRDCKFNVDSSNVVHMTVRPQDIVDEEDASKSKTMARDREGGESTAGCRCVIL